LLKSEPKDFVFDLLKSPPVTSGTGGVGWITTVDMLPVLKGEGVANDVFQIEPCGINLPHIHPRAAELLYVVYGTFRVTLTEENSGRIIVNDVSTGQATAIPQGLMHSEVKYIFTFKYLLKY